MLHRLSFDPAVADHRLFYELGHVLLVTDAEKRTRVEEDRIVDLQADWEGHGKQDGEEKVTGNGAFIAYRFILVEGAKPFDLYIDDATYGLLKKISEEAALLGHVRRFRRPLVDFILSAERGKLVEGTFEPTVPKQPPVKLEDRVLPRPPLKRSRTR